MLDHSRQKTIEFLKRNGESSVAEISRALNLTTVTIRHHLDVLRSMGLIGDPSPRHKAGRGRPEMLYRLTDEAEGHLPRAYDLLTANLLAHLHRTLTARKLENLLAQAGSSLAKEMLAGKQPNRAARIRMALSFFDDHSYFPAVESSQESVLYSLANCPYLESSRQIPLLCSFDQALLQTLLDAQVTFRKRIALGDPRCTLIAIGPDGS
ncbi:MAG: ArsR family transcriptional regulator [Anaerolineales bacterium]|jgi:predicted ArsR family transcriptional regulator